MSVKVSLVASANRVEYWDRLYNSLKGNTVEWEVVFVGDRKPLHEMPSNFKWIHATCKPAQCYQIGFWAAQGETVAWTADDTNYNEPSLNCPNCLDIAYNHWVKMDNQYNNDKKSIIAMNPCEDGGFPQLRFHRFFGGWLHTPTMAPFGLIHREYFVNKLGGYDRRFVSGQSENDVVMRVYEDGGRLEVDLDAKLYVHHRQVHYRDPHTGREDNKFRKWYNTDREVLEQAWVVGGHGFYEQYNAMKPGTEKENAMKNVPISSKRLVPFEPFEKTEDACFVSQGLKGHWN